MTLKHPYRALLPLLLIIAGVTLGSVEAGAPLPTEESSQTTGVKTPPPKPIDSGDGLTINETLLVNGLVRKAWVHLPSYYSTDQKRPLLIVLHGARLSGWIAEAATGFDKIANQENFIVAYPDAIHQQWNDGRAPVNNPSAGIDDVGFLTQLIDYVNWKYHVAKNKVYIAGFSSGGMLAQKMALEQTDKVAAIATVASSLPMPQFTLQRMPSRPISVLMINGTRDRAFPWAGGTTHIVHVKVGPVAPILSTYQYWVKANGGSGDISPRQATVKKNKIGPSVNLLNTRAHNGSCIILYKINGGGHTWPGSEVPLPYIPFLGKQSRDLNASELIWEFFKQQHNDC